MTATDIKTFLKKMPFQPFTLVMSNNERYDVHHPEMLIVGYTSLSLGLARPDDPDPIADQFVWLSTDHVLKVEPLKPPKARQKK
jgi:hypothetical protein